MTCELTVLVMAIGIVIGLMLTIIRLSGNPVMSLAASGYIWFFRGTPVLVQLVFWYNLASLFPLLSLGCTVRRPEVSVDPKHRRDFVLYGRFAGTWVE